ncbi:hypothetical protein COF68_05315 [Bacillus toyonensis]|uniref:hypothetical protein n=1 Tax=Bacillus toyonensis TaxID=155322 RepID=UPI000BFDFDD9|nr:hypothetical protein [Bacillus toyonensis]PHE64262.1 hypothetical protein COF68_05315 [Bacillus toyonensis]
MFDFSGLAKTHTSIFNRLCFLLRNGFDLDNAEKRLKMEFRTKENHKHINSLILQFRKAEECNRNGHQFENNQNINMICTHCGIIQ